MKRKALTNSMIINGIAFSFSAIFLIAAFAAALYTGEWGSVFHNWYTIMITPCPLVMDYFEIGGLASAMLNAGACGMACFLVMALLPGESQPNTLAGYFLVVAHCFYGLNFLNMWPCFLAPFLYLKLKKLNFNNNLHICMFTTSFGPFISEFLFRYTLGDAYVFGTVQLTASGILLALGFSICLGFIVPAILPGAKAWHKGYNLYNGGLAFGLFGFFIFNFMYRTMGLSGPEQIHCVNEIYESFDRNYRLFGSVFFLIIFALCILAGYLLNGKSFKNYKELLKDTGFSSNFAEQYGMAPVLINIGLYGIMFLTYINLIILFTPGAGFTGPTVGVILASLTFTSMGQHPKNVWPIMVGYVLLYLFTLGCCELLGHEITWSISTQGYINGVAFATGLCPIVGRYGVRAGIAAGLMCASMCTATRELHGGFVLYNGGFTAGITALILIPILEHYVPNVRDELKPQNVNAMIAIVENIKPKTKTVKMSNDTKKTRFE